MTRGWSTCMRLKARSWRVSEAARSAARSMSSTLRAAGVALRKNIEQKLGVAFDDHQKIVEVVRDAAGKAADGFHFLRLAELIFEELALADVLRDDEVDGAAGVFEAMRDDFGVDELAVFADVLPRRLGVRAEAGLPEKIEKGDVLGRGAKIEDGHATRIHWWRSRKVLRRRR